MNVEGRKGEPAARGLPPVFLALLLVVPRILAAHDPGLSTLAIEVGAEEVSAILLLDRADLEVPPAAPAGALEVSFDGRPVLPEKADTARAETGALRLSLGFRRPAAARLRVRSAILAQLPRGHRQWVSVHGGDGRVILERLLHAGDPEFEVDLGGGTAAAPERSFSGFLALGAEHVFSGYDHLAFLLGLLLAGGTLLAAAKVITAFSVAHSLTLALSTLGVVSLPPRVVEPLIAASVVYVGIENLFRREPPRRWLLGFGFGLVHGLGFASALGEATSLGGSELAAKLLAFNLGVESAQIAIALPLLPLIRKVRASPAARARWLPAASAALAVAGAWWLWERLAA